MQIKINKEELQSELIINPKFVLEDKKYEPVYSNETDYCMDLKIKIFINEPKTFSYDGCFYQETTKSTYVFPGECKTFGTGLKVAVPNNWGLFIVPRSSTGFKLKCKLANTLGVIDAGYRDEIQMCIHNFGHRPIMLEDGQRVCQMYMLPRYKIVPQYVENDEKFRQGDRGGGIGSTGV